LRAAKEGAEPLKAAIYNNYGPPEVFKIAEVPTPIAKDDEVLVKVGAASVNPYDYHFRGSASPRRNKTHQGEDRYRRSIERTSRSQIKSARTSCRRDVDRSPF